MTEVTFDKVAAAYDRFMGRWSRLYIPALISSTQVKPGDRVLDVAAGTGEAALACAAVVGARPAVVASDISVPMLQITQAKAAGRRVLLLASEGHALACRTGSFDAVICVLGLMFFPDPLAGLQEFHRVLRPGGRLALSVWATPARVPLVSIMLDALVRYLPEERNAIQRAFSLSDEKHLTSLPERAGFSGASVTHERRRLAFDSFEDYWGPVEGGGSRASVPYGKLPPDAREEIRADVRRRLGAFASAGGFHMDVDMLFATGHR